MNIHEAQKKLIYSVAVLHGQVILVDFAFPNMYIKSQAFDFNYDGLACVILHKDKRTCGILFCRPDMTIPEVSDLTCVEILAAKAIMEVYGQGDSFKDVINKSEKQFLETGIPLIRKYTEQMGQDALNIGIGFDPTLN